MNEINDFNRPNHNDFATSAELRSRGFTGVRNNSITHEQELWVEGKVVIAMNYIYMLQNPGAWDKAYSEQFGLHHVETFNGLE